MAPPGAEAVVVPAAAGAAVVALPGEGAAALLPILVTPGHWGRPLQRPL